MKRKVTVIFISFLIPIFLISAGYGAWEKKLIITGTIKVVKPVPQTTPNQEVKIDAPLSQTDPVDTNTSGQPNQDSTNTNVESVNPDTTNSDSPTTNENQQVTEPIPSQSSDPNSTTSETNTGTNPTDATPESTGEAPTN